MVKMIIAFIALFLIFFFGIDLFRRFTRKEKIRENKCRNIFSDFFLQKKLHLIWQDFFTVREF